LHHKSQGFEHFGVLMTYKAPFCTFFWLTRTVFSRLLKKAILMVLWTKASLCVKSSLLEQSLPRLVRHPFGGTPSRPKTSAIAAFSAVKNSCLRVLVAINPFNQRNPRLIKDLRLFMALYNCRDTFTDVMSALQIHLFMQNKANFRKVKLNVNKVLTKDYEQMDTWSIRKTKPIQSQLKPIQSQLKPKQTQFKPNSCPPRRLAGLPAISVAGQSQNMLLILTTLKVLENSIIKSYHLEPTRPINLRRLP
jgi:hypothetical protein